MLHSLYVSLCGEEPQELNKTVVTISISLKDRRVRVLPEGMTYGSSGFIHVHDSP